MRHHAVRGRESNEPELLTSLREAEQNYKIAAAEYKRLLDQSKDSGLLNPDLARLARHLLNAVNHVLAGRGFHILPTRAAQSTPPISGREKLVHFACLSRRENQILCSLAQGLRPKEIARALNLSPKTVDAHKTNAMRKLNVHSFADLLRLVISRESPEGTNRSNGTTG